MSEFIHTITNGAETFTPDMVVMFMALIMGLECIASIIQALIKGVR